MRTILFLHTSYARKHQLLRFLPRPFWAATFEWAGHGRDVAQTLYEIALWVGESMHLNMPVTVPPEHAHAAYPTLKQ